MTRWRPMTDAEYRELLGRRVTPLTATLKAVATECRTLRGLVGDTVACEPYIPRNMFMVSGASCYLEGNWIATPPRIPVMGINLRPPRGEKPWQFLNALSRAYRRVRREVWTERESRLLAKWESYG